MSCPYLGTVEDAEGARECHAQEWVFEPSSLELEQYCKTRLHRWCPLYRALSAGPTVYRAGKRRHEVQRATG